MTELIIPLFAVFVAFNGAIPLVLVQMVQRREQNSRSAANSISMTYQYAGKSTKYCWSIWFFLCLTMFYDTSHNGLFIFFYTFFCSIPIILMSVFIKEVKSISGIYAQK